MDKREAKRHVCRVLAKDLWARMGVDDFGAMYAKCKTPGDERLIRSAMQELIKEMERRAGE